MAQETDSNASCFMFFYNHKKHQNCLASLGNQIRDLLDETGDLWILSEDVYSEKELKPNHFSIGETFQKNGFYWKDVVVWYNIFDIKKPLPIKQRYKILLLLSKEKNNFTLNIDKVREKSIWKESEWGGGRESRYNEKGKNPSNFWLKQNSKNGEIKEHVILTKEDVIKRCILLSTNERDKILTNEKMDYDMKNLVTDLDRDLEIKNLEKQKENINESVEKKYDFEIDGPREATNSKLDESKIYYNTSENMEEIPSRSVQTIITSPPYWGLRDYDSERQIGFDEEYESYLSRISQVFTECHRVLKENGTFWLNINKRKMEGDILDIPGDLYRISKNIGFFLKDIIFWHRAISVPHSKDLLTNRLEYIFLFSKDKDEIKFHPKKCDWEDYVDVPNSKLTNVWRLYRKFGTIGKEISRRLKDKKIKHTAVYPKELVRRAVLLSTDKNDYVLDPFMGSGTTAVVANKLGRNWIGYEINKDYKSIIDWRLEEEGISLERWIDD